MKILVLSDSHGDLTTLKKVADKYSVNADIIVHCGDGTRNDATFLQENYRNAMVVCVRGNCDFGSPLNYYEKLNIMGKNILITHGHLHNVKYSLVNLSYKAQEENCDIVLYGHTHIANDQTLAGVRLINPGACGGWGASCAVVEIDAKENVLVNLIKV